MELKLIWKHARAAVLECCEGSIYEMAQPCQIYLNGEFYKETKQVVNVLYDLEPEKEYCVAVQKGEEKSEIVFCTEAQDYTLNVRDFGAKEMAFRMIRHISRLRSWHVRRTVVC